MDATLKDYGGDVLVFCGGKGTRLHSLASRYHCKTLVEFHGKPAIQYVLEEVRSAMLDRIVLCIDRLEIIPPIEKVLEKMHIRNIEIYIDCGRGPMPAMYEASKLCKGNQALVIFGHHLITANHIRNLLDFRSNPVVSLYKTTSESHCKITSTNEFHVCTHVSRHDKVLPLASDESYIDLPYVLPIPFFMDYMFPTIKRLFIKGEMSMQNLSKDEVMFGLSADFPHEFHTVQDLPTVELFAETLLNHQP